MLLLAADDEVEDVAVDLGEEVMLLLLLALPVPLLAFADEDAADVDVPAAVAPDDAIGNDVVNAICCFLRNSALFGGGGLAGLFIS